MKIKRKTCLAVAVAFIFLFTFSTVAMAYVNNGDGTKTYTIDDIEITITIPENAVVGTRDFCDDEELFDFLLDGKNYKDLIEADNAYLVAFDLDEGVFLEVIKRNAIYDDFDNFSDKEFKDLISSISIEYFNNEALNSLSEDNFDIDSSKILPYINSTKYLTFSISNYSGFNIKVYMTEQGYGEYKIVFQSAENELSNSYCEKIVDSVKYNSNSAINNKNNFTKKSSDFISSSNNANDSIFEDDSMLEIISSIVVTVLLFLAGIFRKTLKKAFNVIWNAISNLKSKASKKGKISPVEMEENYRQNYSEFNNNLQENDPRNKMGTVSQLIEDFGFTDKQDETKIKQANAIDIEANIFTSVKKESETKKYSFFEPQPTEKLPVSPVNVAVNTINEQREVKVPNFSNQSKITANAPDKPTKKMLFANTGNISICKKCGTEAVAYKVTMITPEATKSSYLCRSCLNPIYKKLHGKDIDF